MFLHSSGRSDRLIFYNWSSGLQEELREGFGNVEDMLMGRSRDR